MRRLTPGWAVLVCWARLAHADVASEALTIGRLMHDLRYEEVIQRGLRLLRDVKPADREAVPAVYRLIGTAYYLLGDAPHARAELVRLFALDPDAQPPPEASPKLRQFFDRVRVEAASVALDPAPLKEVGEGRPIVISARLAGSADVERTVVHFRTEGTGGYSMRRLERSGEQLFVRLPGLFLADRKPRAFEYWLEARDATGSPLAVVGTEAAPLRATIIPQPNMVPQPLSVLETALPPAPTMPAPIPSDGSSDRPAYKKWWVWGLVGVAATAAIVGLYFAVRSGPGGPPQLCVDFGAMPCPH